MKSRHQDRVDYDALVDLLSPVIAGCIMHGVIRNCTDTDWPDELDLQDDLIDVIQKHIDRNYDD